MSSWVAFTVLAALMQSVRTAGQKQLSGSVSPMTATLARYLFGLPFVAVYVLFLFRFEASSALGSALSNPVFMLYAISASVAQIIATVLLVRVFSFRNFAVGTSFAKTEAIQTAVIGMALFGSTLTERAWLAIVIGFIGIAVVSVPVRNTLWEPRNILLGTLSGTAFAFTSLWLREASLSLPYNALASAAITLAVMVAMQTLICCVYSYLKEPGQLQLLFLRWPLALFIGLSSAMGSAGWFTAMTLQNPAVVKSVGQIEFIFTLLITTIFFKERISGREYLGMMLIITSVVLLLS